MTHTAEPMTLAQVSEDVKDVYYSAPDQLIEAIVPLRKLLAWKRVVDAELAKQREAEPVAWRYRFSGSNDWKYAGTGEGLVDPRPLIKSEPLYTHPQQRNVPVEVSDNELPGMWSSTDFTGGDTDERSYAERNAVEVTDTKQYPSEDHNCEYQNGDGKCFECTDLAVLENCRSMIEKAVTNHCSGGDLYLSTLLAARNIITTLSAVASRDREDAERYRWLRPLDERTCSGLLSEKDAIAYLENEELDKAIDAARRENKP